MKGKQIIRHSRQGYYKARRPRHGSRKASGWIELKQKPPTSSPSAPPVTGVPRHVIAARLARDLGATASYGIVSKRPPDKS